MGDEQNPPAAAIRPPFRVEWNATLDLLAMVTISKQCAAKRVYSLCLLFFRMAIIPPGLFTTVRHHSVYFDRMSLTKIELWAANRCGLRVVHLLLVEVA
jgi:hypothetical protein